MGNNDQVADSNHLRFHPLATAFIVVYFVALIVSITAPRLMGNESLLTPLLFPIIYSCIGIAVPSALVWFFSRSYPATNLTCAAMVFALFVFSGFQLFQYMQASDQSTPPRSASSTPPQLGSPAAPASMNHSKQDVDQAVALVKQISLDARPITNQRVVLYNQYVEAGACMPSTLRSSDEITARITMLNQLIEITQEQHAVYMAQEGKINQVLAPVNLPQQLKQQMVADWKRGAKPELIDQLRKHELESYGTHQQLLSLLHNHYGQWSISGDGEIRTLAPFNDPGFDALLEQVYLDADKLDRLQQEYRRAVELTLQN